MSQKQLNERARNDAPVDRPVSVDRALYALGARCVLATASALALFGARSEVRSALAKTNPTWSAATLDAHINSQLRANLIASIVYTLMVLVVAKFIRDGKGWARLLYLVFAFLMPADVLQVLGFFADHNLLLRVLSGLYGLSAIAAVVLLFLPSSSQFFRRPGVAPLMSGMFRPRLPAKAASPANSASPASGTVPGVALTKPSPAATAGPAAGAEPDAQRPPRAKSRRGTAK